MGVCEKTKASHEATIPSIPVAQLSGNPLQNTANSVVQLKQNHKPSSKCNCIICSETNLEIKTAKMFLIFNCDIPCDKLDKGGDITCEFIGWKKNIIMVLQDI